MEQSIPSTMPIEITLSAAEWNVVLGMLAEAPYRVAAPLINQIQEQARAVAAGGANGASEAVHVGNGATAP